MAGAVNISSAGCSHRMSFKHRMNYDFSAGDVIVRHMKRELEYRKGKTTAYFIKIKVH